MNFEINPRVGVGPIQFGMSRDAVRKALGSQSKEFMKTPSAILPTDDFPALSLHVYYEGQLVCRGVEFFRGSQVTLDKRPIAGRPFSEVMEWLKKLDPAATLDDDSVVNSELLGLSLWAPDADDDLDSLIQSVYVSAGKA